MIAARRPLLVNRALIGAAVSAALIASACTSSGIGFSDPPPPGEIAETFLAAWNDGDHAAMEELLSDVGEIDATVLERTLERVVASGAVDSFEVGTIGTAAPTPDSPEDGDDVEVPFSIMYESAAAARPVVMEGALPLTFDEDDSSWEVEWDRSVPFPGLDRGVRFEVTYRWLKRGSLLDADRRKLATGPIERRRYPYGELAGTTVGHVAPATKEDAAELGVSPGDLVGASGLEKGLQSELAGRPASRLAVVDRRGREVQVVGRRKGKPGANVRTTLDVDVQRAAQAAYGSTTGGAVVMDPETGDVLAAVSSSPFNPNRYVGVAGVEPFNRAFEGLYPPGSAMKVVTAAGALDSGAVTENTELTGPSEYQGVRNFESGEFGTLTFATAVQYSVNTAFAQVAVKLGAKKLTDYAEGFGFNQPLEMPVTAETPSFPFPEDPGDLMWGSIGQAQVLATPLQMASIAATIANDGKRMEPRISRSDRPHGTRAVSRKTAETMTRLMIRVVVGGTGQAARLAGVDVAGKTGTAEVDVGGERKNHAWFICFAPAEDPDLAVAVVSEYGGVGGEVAAPLARQILASSLLILQAEEFREDAG